MATAGDSHAVSRDLTARHPPGDRARIDAIGISIGDPCGVHDHAVLLPDRLAPDRFAFAEHWLWRTGGALASERAEAHEWTERISRELARERPDAVLLHYSVFAFSHRGVPVLVKPVLSSLDELRVPLVPLMSQFA